MYRWKNRPNWWCKSRFRWHGTTFSERNRALMRVEIIFWLLLRISIVFKIIHRPVKVAFMMLFFVFKFRCFFSLIPAGLKIRIHFISSSVLRLSWIAISSIELLRLTKTMVCESWCLSTAPELGHSSRSSRSRRTNFSKSLTWSLLFSLWNQFYSLSVLKIIQCLSRCYSTIQMGELCGFFSYFRK